MTAPATWVSSVVDGWSVTTVDGPGVTLIWLHGLGEHAATFAPAIAHLPQHRHLLLDLPGHGGARALEAAARAPWSRPPSIAETAALADCTYSSQIAAYAEEDFVAHGHAAVCDRLAAHADPIVRGYGARMRTASPTQLWRYSHDLVDASTPETSARRRAAVAAPLSYVAGHPGGASLRSRELLAAAGVNVHEIAPAGHWPFVEHPARFAEVVAALVGLSSTPARGR